MGHVIGKNRERARIPKHKNLKHTKQSKPNPSLYKWWDPNVSFSMSVTLQLLKTSK